jgi:hypothetical protein
MLHSIIRLIYLIVKEIINEDQLSILLIKLTLILFEPFIVASTTPSFMDFFLIPRASEAPGFLRVKAPAPSVLHMLWGAGVIIPLRWNAGCRVTDHKRGWVKKASINDIYLFQILG